MNVAELAGELAAAAGEIDGLRVLAHPGLRVNPPCLVIGFPDRVAFDATYGRGVDQIELPLFLMLSRLSERAAAGALFEYLGGSGDRSIKAAIEAYTYTAADVVHVVDAVTQTFVSEGTEYVGALFSLTISGRGA